MLALALLPQNGMPWVRWGLYLMTTRGTLPGLLMWTFASFQCCWSHKEVGDSHRPDHWVLCYPCHWCPALGRRSRYSLGLTGCSVTHGAEFALILLWRVWYAYQNIKRDDQVATISLMDDECKMRPKMNAEGDMTDLENVFFRYSL